MSVRYSQGTKPVFCLLAASVAWSAAALAQSPGAGQPPPRITEAYTVEPADTLSPEESLSLARAAGRILLHVERARDALALRDVELDDNDPDLATAAQDATAQVEQALKLVAVVEAAAPRYDVTSSIRAGDAEYTESDTVQPLQIPVYGELEQVDVLDAVVEAKRRGSPAAFPVVRDVRVQHTRAVLDVAAAKEGLTLARRELADGDLDAADATLVGLQRNDVVLEFAEVDLPLEAARVNLRQAERSLRADRLDEVRFDLASAVDALARYHTMVGPERAAEVETLRNQVRALYTDLDNRVKTDKEGSLTQLGNWWHQVVRWFETA